MLHIFRLLLRSFLLTMAVFVVGKLAFMLYNHAEYDYCTRDVYEVLRHGLTMDACVSGYLLVVPWLVCLVAVWRERLPLHPILVGYYVVVALLLAAIIGGDIVLYEYWKFKLNAAIFSYLESIEGVTNSVSVPYMVGCTLAFLLCAVAIAWAAIRGIPKTIDRVRHPRWATLLMVLIGGATFIVIRGGVHTSTMNVGVPYYSQHLFLNHSAVNPAFSLLSSLKRSEDFSRQFRYQSEAECAQTFAGLYPEPSDALTDTLLVRQRPNVLVIFMEGFGGKFVAEMGGLTDVAPYMSRNIPKGIFWSNVYANSFRTDRGTVSTFSGYVSYPTTSLMKLPQHNQHLPGLAKSLRSVGYDTSFLYAGDIKVMGLNGYLVNSGFSTLWSDDDFTVAERNESKWGANDRVAAERVLQLIRERQGERQPWMMTFQTLSSHEPFEVPYDRLEDKKLNAFAFTDECVGQLVDSLRHLPLWRNLLVVLVPDHGFLYDLTYESPEYFHIPMLWLGGAIREPRTMPVLMNQSDLAATLLAQMGIPHDDYPWSRNVLSPTYTYPFAYSTFPSGILFRDSTGVSVYDITSNTPITEHPQPSPERIRRAKAILQTSYDRLQGL